MTASDKRQTAINRGMRAKALLDDPLLQEAFQTLEEQYIALWKTLPAVDSDGRERLWIAVNQVGKVREHLHRVMSTGKLAQDELRWLEEQAEADR